MVSWKIRKVDTKHRTFTKECTNCLHKRTNINLLEKDSSFPKERTNKTTRLRATVLVIYLTPHTFIDSSAVHK